MKDKEILKELWRWKKRLGKAASKEFTNSFNIKGKSIIVLHIYNLEIVLGEISLNMFVDAAYHNLKMFDLKEVKNMDVSFYVLKMVSVKTVEYFEK